MRNEELLSLLIHLREDVISLGAGESIKKVYLKRKKDAKLRLWTACRRRMKETVSPLIGMEVSL